MKSKSSLVSLGICFYLSIGLIFGCQTNSSPNSLPTNSSIEKAQPQNKLTYQNPELRLGFTYPQGFQIEEFEQRVAVWKDTDYQNKQNFVEATPLVISIRENSDNLSPMAWVERRVFLIEGEVTQKLVADSEAIDFQWTGMWLYRSVVVSHRERNQLIMITWDQHLSDYQVVFDEIVATLELL